MRCSKTSRSATARSSSTSIRSGGGRPESPFVSKTKGISSSYTLGLIRTVRPSGACMQYAPETHGVLLWDLFPQYQTRAQLRENGWNHIRMVVSGRRMNIFVNDATSPTLQVGRLEGDAMKGGLRLQGPGTFANMVITPDVVDGLSPEPAGDPLETDRGLVRNWRLATFSSLPNDKDARYDEMPGAFREWKTISTERNG